MHSSPSRASLLTARHVVGAPQRRGAFQRSGDGGLATARIGLALRCRVCWVLQAGRRTKRCAFADWCRHPAQRVGFLVQPRTPGRPSSLFFDGASQAFRKEASFPGFVTAAATSDGQVTVPSLSRARRLIRGKMVGRLADERRRHLRRLPWVSAPTTCRHRRAVRLAVPLPGHAQDGLSAKCLIRQRGPREHDAVGFTHAVVHLDVACELIEGCVGDASTRLSMD